MLYLSDFERTSHLSVLEIAAKSRERKKRNFDDQREAVLRRVSQIANFIKISRESDEDLIREYKRLKKINEELKQVKAEVEKFQSKFKHC